MENKVKGKRFVDMPASALAPLDKLKPVVFPKDQVSSFKTNDSRVVTFRAINDIEKEAGDIAAIFQKGVDEVVGNVDYEWYHNPKAIIESVKAGNFFVYGGYMDGKLITVGTCEISQGHRMFQPEWLVIDPKYRGLGIFSHLVTYLDQVAMVSEAQVGLAWCVTTHPYAQVAWEGVGWKPVGLFPGAQLLGGSDGKYFRATIAWYAKVFDKMAPVQPESHTFMTHQTQQMYDLIKDMGDS